MEWLSDFIAAIPSMIARAIFSFIANLLSGGVFDALPDSPTFEAEWLDTLELYAGYINYFIPVHAILIFAAGLLTCIAVYYSVSIVLRLVKVVS